MPATTQTGARDERLRCPKLKQEMNDSRPSPQDVIEAMYAAWRTDGRNPLWLDGAETRLNGTISFRVTPP
ncbi:hypothetical protein [Haloarcula montana]|uniref:hypothetical protein n=1 Tax=Haloarcula montana TaxID=3111776 RepID=UPI002D774472|nr:hypothetical protein [Haloarcula sp. GH36]